MSVIQIFTFYPEKICMLEYITRASLKFCSSLIHVYHVSKAVEAMEHICCDWLYHGSWYTHTLLLSMCDLKVTQMNVKCSLIQKLMLYNFVLGHNSIEATKNICCVIERWKCNWSQHSNLMVQEISLGLQELWWSGKIK